MNSKYSVVVVGAGPVGLLTALKLGQKGVSTLVLEKHSEILDASRAIAYMPVVMDELRKIGLLDAVKSDAFVNHALPAWRKLDGTELATPGLPESEIISTDDAPAALILGQQYLARIILDHLSSCDSVTIKFSTSCVGIETSDGHARVMVRGDAEEHIISADWVVGADGSNSSIRRMCLIPFEGFTWGDFRFTATDVRYDFEKEGGYRAANFVVDPVNWAIIARTGPHGVWRTAYGETFDKPGDEESVRERSKKRIPEFLPGVKDYELLRIKPYVTQQRCAATFTKGRVVLTNNPVGGLGLTGGILDAVLVGNALLRCILGGEDDAVIRAAAGSCRDTWRKVTDPTSTSNFLRLWSEDPEVSKDREEFFEKIRTDEEFPMAFGRALDDMLPDTFEKS